MSTDPKREALARSVREKARSALGRATGPDLRGDNLGIALLTYISPSHPDDDCGWHPSAVDAVNAIFDDAIANLLAAGWMPRPEPGSTDSVIAAFRIAAEVIAADEDRLRKLRVFADYWPTIDAYDPPPEVAEDVSEIVQAMVALADATRAALGTGDKTGPEVHDGR